MPNFLEALRTRVKALAPDLSEVYLSSSDPSAVLPFLIINKLWEDTFETSIPGEDYKEVRLQFTLFSFSDVQAEVLGKAVYKGLKPHRRFTGPTDRLDDTIGEQKVWRTMFDFTWDVGMNEDD
jgi:hypothetical protein